ncbi:ATP-binding cassette domain-containing protein [Myxococcota bacterium]|nr:ATP-binding cassette domain-containing protein [Myxococcota bacterium]
MTALLWPRERLGEAAQALARAAGVDGPAPPGRLGPGEDVDRWLGGWASPLGIELEPLAVRFADAGDVLEGAGPALLAAGDSGFLVLLAPGRGRPRVLAPDLSVRRVPTRELRALLSGALEAQHGPGIERVLDAAGIPERRRGAARERLMEARSGSAELGRAWAVRREPGDSFPAQLSEARVPGRALAHGAAFLVALALEVTAWVMLGRGALAGRLDWGWLWGWALVLATAVPIHAAGVWWAGLVALDLGAALKRRLLAGALALEPGEVRHAGAGLHMARVIESDEVETLATQAGFLATAGLLELGVAGAILTGVLGPAGAAAVAVHALAVAWIARGAWRARKEWTRQRLEMTHGLVERLVGHRTRLAQESPSLWHLEEDAALEAYLGSSRRMDAWEVALQLAGARGFLVVALGAALPGFVSGGGSTAAVAGGIAAAMLGSRAWSGLTPAITGLMGSALAWEQVRDLFRAAERRAPAAATGVERLPTSEGAAVVHASQVSYRHPGQPRPVFQGVDLRVDRGDRVLLLGPSGAGKSTLASLLTGLRTPTSGLVRLSGIDHRTLGAAAWRRRVASAPQFHENHVLTGTLAFNVLMGRGWPATDAVVREAEELLRALELGPLLDRMPSGMLQVVGETGWQLSHGERSRVFLARALLQGADLVVLDETFGALDPATLRRAMGVTLDRARALVVIAHP